ncbi:MAG: 30S ribosomal protein S13 [Planctomycetota bacterium]|jgi:small subunit ribosomal protein S13|nr:30S ribosomal protein S13 [Planctomycetota bacterium]MEC9030435.1 30S ribosomal protein S13 [Planctomycetota bacterium]MEE3298432.1 30S ribosomal protein S13 [Planctomycetota bacterium]|tara:strand:+ start:312 stop:692 length:381 start_codon:yes stop_codon:yes gene_type:complete
MPRISGVDIPADKQIGISLTYIKGIGHTLAGDLLNKVGIGQTVKARDLTEEELSRIASTLEDEYVIEGRLRREIQQNITRLKEINSYRGIRHKKGLPVRGQRTKTNSRTRKGPRKVVATKKSVKQM